MADPFTQWTLPRKTVLRILLAADQPLSTTEILQKADLQRSTTDNILSRLERSGWATSERGAVTVSEGRGTHVRRLWQLTAAGRDGAEAGLSGARTSRLSLEL